MTLFRVVVVAQAVVWSVSLYRLYRYHGDRPTRSFRRISIGVILTAVLVTMYCFVYRS